MKQLFLFILLFSLSAQAQVSEMLEVAETFSTNPSGIALTSSNSNVKWNWGWQQVYNSAGVRISSPNNPNVITNRGATNYTQPFNAGKYVLASEYGYLESGAGADMIYLSTMGKTVSPITRTGKELSRVEFDIAHNYIASNSAVFFAVKLANGTVYALKDSVVQTTTSGTGATPFQVHSVHANKVITSSSPWWVITNATVAGSTMTVNRTDVTLPANSNVVEYGFFLTKAPGSTSTSVMRMDNLHIYSAPKGGYTIPAQPTGVSTAGGVLGWAPVSGYAAANLYEYTTDGGLTWTTCTANPQTLVSSSYFAAYQVGVRVKENTASNYTYSQTGWASNDYTAYPNLVYKESFPYLSTSGSVSPSAYGFRMAWLNGGTLDTTNSQSMLINQPAAPGYAGYKSANPILNQNGYMQTGASTTIALFYTYHSFYTFSRYSQDLSKVRFQTANNTTTWAARFACKFEGSNDWYALVDSTVQTVTSGGTDATAFSTHTRQAEFDITSATTWYKVTFTPTALVLDRSATYQNPQPSQSITAIGILYTHGSASSSVRRWDNIELYFTPKPVKSGWIPWFD